MSEPLFVKDDWVVLNPKYENFPACSRGPWKVSDVFESEGDGYVVRLEGFNDFHESWFLLAEKRGVPESAGKGG